MTQADVIAALPGGRLPPDLMTLHFADMLALFGSGLVLAVLAAVLFMPFVRRRPSTRAQIRATRSLPPEERLLEIARILGRLPEGLRRAAYGIEAPPSDEAIERMALRARNSGSRPRIDRSPGEGCDAAGTADR